MKALRYDFHFPLRQNVPFEHAMRVAIQDSHAANSAYRIGTGLRKEFHSMARSRTE